MLDERLTLTGDHVELIALAPEHADELLAAASVERSSYGFTEVPADADQMADYIERLLDKRRAGSDLPFAQRQIDDGRLVGCTRYLEIRRWRGRSEPDEVEIGGTWLSADAQRSAVNTEAKLLLLTQAFEHWDVVRVALATDARNERSRTAIARIGANFEGILRHHRPSTVAAEPGRPRDTALFAITDDDWPGVRQTLRERLDRPGRRD